MAKAEHQWLVLHEVREIREGPDVVKGDVGAEHTGPYRVVFCQGGECCEGTKKIVPFTPEELQVSEVLDNVRVGEGGGVTKIVKA